MTTERPKVNAKGQQELDKAQEHFDQFDAQVKALTLDERNKAPIADFEPQTKMSNREIAASAVQYIKPARSIGSREKFNEAYRQDYERAKTYVKCIVENNEIKGERVDLWTKPFPGMPAELWELPTNKPIAVPSYVAERCANCTYHVLVTEEKSITEVNSFGSMYGAMVVKETRHRIDARPVGNAFVSMGS
jgi:hypothetical protein